MGTRGPAPKRSTQRRRKNKTDVEQTSSTGKKHGRALTGRHSALAKRFWEALRTSGQAQFYEDSDWAAAELVVAAIDAFVKAPNAAMLASINTSMAGLLVTEASRRRVSLELTRAAAGEDDDDSEVTHLDAYRRRLTG